MIRVNVIGGKRLARIAARAPDLARAAVARALHAEAQGIMTASKPLVPIDTGALRASGYVPPPRVVGDRVVQVLGYGGPAVPYALKVHEDLDAFHPVGSAKYLEIPFRAARAGMAGRITRDVRAEMRSVTRG